MRFREGTKPIEILYLYEKISEVKQIKAPANEDYLAATLAHLACEGYLSPHRIDIGEIFLDPTRKAKEILNTTPSNLYLLERIDAYELDILDMISSGKEIFIHDLLDNIPKETFQTNELIEKYANIDDLVFRLENFKEETRKRINRAFPSDKNALEMAYSFPDRELRDALLSEYSEISFPNMLEHAINNAIYLLPESDKKETLESINGSHGEYLINLKEEGDYFTIYHDETIIGKIGKNGIPSLIDSEGNRIGELYEVRENRFEISDGAYENFRSGKDFVVFGRTIEEIYDNPNPFDYIKRVSNEDKKRTEEKRDSELTRKSFLDNLKYLFKR